MPRTAPVPVLPPAIHPRPDAPRHAQLDGWDASDTALLDWLRPRITPAGLDTIAAADYGHRAGVHRVALTDLVATGELPARFDHGLREVLELTRWSEPPFDHAARAFCCVLLVLASPDDELVHTGPPLVESCLALGDEAAGLGERLLVWQHEHLESDVGDSRIALLLLAILHAARQPDDPRLADLLRRVVESPGPTDLRASIDEAILASRWRALIDTYLRPLSVRRPDCARQVAVFTADP